jgi:hypothetical protein
MNDECAEEAALAPISAIRRRRPSDSRLDRIDPRGRKLEYNHEHKDSEPWRMARLVETGVVIPGKKGFVDIAFDFAISGIGWRRMCTEIDAHVAQGRTEVSTN